MTPARELQPTAAAMPSGIIEAMSRMKDTNVFVHGVTSIGNLAGVNLDDEESHRALFLAGEQDIVVVPSAVDRDFLDYMLELGMTPPIDRIVVASDGAAPSPNGSMAETLMSNPGALSRLGTMCGASAVVLNPFIATEVEWRLADALGATIGRSVRVIGAPPDRVRNANMKHVIRERAAQCGVPVAPAAVVRMRHGSQSADQARLSATLAECLRVSGRVVVKGSFGASGSSTFIVEADRDIAACTQLIANREDNDIYIVEPFFDVICSPNVVMWIDPESGDISCVSVNDQRVDGRLVFAGSVFPTVASLLPAMIDSAARLTNALKEEGFSGAAGFDFCEYENSQTGVREYFLSELNARINGGMYATALMERVNGIQTQRGLNPVTAFRSVNIFVPPTNFATVRQRCGGLMFDGVRGTGVIPFNPGRLAAGKVTVACIGADAGTVEELLTGVREVFN